MNGAVEWVKAHPIITGVSIIAVIAGTWILTSGGASADGGSSVAMVPNTDANIAGQVAIQQLQGALSAQQDRTRAELTLGLASISADKYKTELAGMLSTRALESTEAIAALDANARNKAIETSHQYNMRQLDQTTALKNLELNNTLRLQEGQQSIQRYMIDADTARDKLAFEGQKLVAATYSKLIEGLINK